MLYMHMCLLLVHIIAIVIIISIIIDLLFPQRVGRPGGAAGRLPNALLRSPAVLSSFAWRQIYGVSRVLRYTSVAVAFRVIIFISWPLF